MVMVHPIQAGRVFFSDLGIMSLPTCPSSSVPLYVVRSYIRRRQEHGSSSSAVTKGGKQKKTLLRVFFKRQGGS